MTTVFYGVCVSGTNCYAVSRMMLARCLSASQRWKRRKTWR